jgi:hypothetical protein
MTDATFSPLALCAGCKLTQQQCADIVRKHFPQPPTF